MRCRPHGRASISRSWVSSTTCRSRRNTASASRSRSSRFRRRKPWCRDGSRSRGRASAAAKLTLPPLRSSARVSAGGSSCGCAARTATSTRADSTSKRGCSSAICAPPATCGRIRRTSGSTAFAGRPRDYVQRARESIRERIRRALPDAPYAGVLIALAIGDQRAIPEAQWLVFNRTGVAHLVSISGLHVTVFAALAGGIAFRILRRSPRLTSRIPARKLAAIAGAACALGYVLLAGAEVPAVRTLLMLAVGACGLWLGRPGTAALVWLWSLAAVLAVGPLGAPCAGLLAVVRCGRPSAVCRRGRRIARASRTSWRSRLRRALARRRAHAVDRHDRPRARNARAVSAGIARRRARQRLRDSRRDAGDRPARAGGHRAADRRDLARRARALARADGAARSARGLALRTCGRSMRRRRGRSWSPPLGVLLLLAPRGVPGRALRLRLGCCRCSSCVPAPPAGRRLSPDGARRRAGARRRRSRRTCTRWSTTPGRASATGRCRRAHRRAVPARARASARSTRWWSATRTSTMPAARCRCCRRSRWRRSDSSLPVDSAIVARAAASRHVSALRGRSSVGMGRRALFGAVSAASSGTPSRGVKTNDLSCVAARSTRAYGSALLDRRHRGAQRSRAAARGTPRDLARGRARRSASRFADFVDAAVRRRGQRRASRCSRPAIATGSAIRGRMSSRATRAAGPACCAATSTAPSPSTLRPRRRRRPRSPSASVAERYWYRRRRRRSARASRLSASGTRMTASEPHRGLAFARPPRRHDQHAVVVRRADLARAVAREQRAALRRRPASPRTGSANANASVAIVTTSVTSIARCGGSGAGSRCASRNAGGDHAEVAQEAQRRLHRDGGRGALPVLAAFDQQRVARIGGIVEERVVAQALAGRVAAVDDDVLAARPTSCASSSPLRWRPASASGGQGSVIECRSSR